MRRSGAGAALMLLCCVAPTAAQNVQKAAVCQARERAVTARREAIVPRPGERVQRDQTVPGVAPLARINNRIAARLSTRLGTRVERTTNDGRDRIGVSRATLDDNSRRR